MRVIFLPLHRTAFDVVVRCQVAEFVLFRWLGLGGFFIRHNLVLPPAAETMTRRPSSYREDYDNYSNSYTSSRGDVDLKFH